MNGKAGMCCFPEILQNFSERQILWSLCSVVFHALTLKLPIRTLLSVARKLPVFTRSGEKCENLSKTSTPWNGNKNCCQSVDLPSFITACKRSLGQGNIFRSVCQEFYLSTGESASVHAGIPPPRRGRDPQDQAPISWDQVHPPRPGTPSEQSMLGDTVNERAVRILLECILVFHGIEGCSLEVRITVFPELCV